MAAPFVKSTKPASPGVRALALALGGLIGGVVYLAVDQFAGVLRVLLGLH
jgi:hypothetical protein